jgi:hypothetical protein
MLPTTLNTNEVKDSTGAEQEFVRMSTEGRKLMFSRSGETPSAPHRITISHSEVGAADSRRRRSLARVDKTVDGTSGTPRVISAYVVLDAPVGDLATTSEVKNVVANLLSFVASTGATTTILYDCSGHGADSLCQGTL